MGGISMGVIKKLIKFLLPKQHIGLHGRVRAVVHDEHGNIYSDSGWTDNQETNWSASAVAQWLAGINNTGYNPVKFPNYMELGTGSGVPNKLDVSLFAATPATNQKCSVTSASSNVATFVCQYYGVSSNIGTYTEAGLMDSDGHLFGHLMAAISIQLGLSTSVTWQLSVNV